MHICVHTMLLNVHNIGNRQNYNLPYIKRREIFCAILYYYTKYEYFVFFPFANFEGEYRVIIYVLYVILLFVRDRS